MCKQYDLRMKNRLPVLREVQNYGEQNVCVNPSDMARMINSIFECETLCEEHVWAIAFNTKLKPIGVFEISHGTDESCAITPRELFTRLLLCGAKRFVLAHNHPSGDVSPSNEDRETTERFQECGKVMNIPLIDHIIIGDRNYYSFCELGII